MICYKDITYCTRQGCPRKSCPRNLMHVDWSYGLPVCMAYLWGQWGICPPRPPREIDMKEDVPDDQRH